MKLKAMTEDQVSALVGRCARLILIPNWFTREQVESILGHEPYPPFAKTGVPKLTDDEWKSFHEWVQNSTVGDDISNQVRSWWGDWLADFEEPEEKEGE
jgi:hypothetical protein